MCWAVIENRNKTATITQLVLRIQNPNSQNIKDLVLIYNLRLSKKFEKIKYAPYKIISSFMETASY
jgi:hypothetical protein